MNKHDTFTPGGMVHHGERYGGDGQKTATPQHDPVTKGRLKRGVVVLDAEEALDSTSEPEDLGDWEGSSSE